MPAKESSAMTFSRRAAMALGIGGAMLPLAAGPTAANGLDLGDAAPVRQAAARFLASLDDAQRTRARFPFGGDAWKRWNYFGVTGYIKPGLRLEEMAAAQKDAAWALTAAILSQEGVDKARRVMLNQEILREQGNGVNERSGERFSYAIFGEPSASGAWALRIEGHHLSLSYSIRNDRLTGITPSSFSSSPNRVATGRHAGLVTLRREDALARRLAGDLTGAVRARAFQQTNPYNNILASAGREKSLTKREGIPVGDLNQGQRDMAEEVLSAFMVEHLKSPYAEPVSRILRDGRDATHFTALGSPRPEEALYYRFHGDRFVVEFASVDSAALHLHTIFHLA
jgi:hypothetical protein